MEILHITSYLITIEIFALSFTISKKFAIDMCMILALKFRMECAKVKCKYANENPISDFFFYNIYNIDCIHSRNMHDVDVDL